MEINAYYTRSQINENGDTELVFTVKGMASKRILEDVVKDVLYHIKLMVVNDKRTVQQNRLCWLLTDSIAEKTGNKPMDVYCWALQEADAKHVYLACTEEAKDSVIGQFRAGRVVGNYIAETGTKMLKVQCFYGSSKFNKDEMGKLLDVLIAKANEYGIYVREVEI